MADAWPSDADVSELIASIDGHNLKRIRADLQAALERERRCGTTEPDGFPGSTSGGGGGSGTGDPVAATMLARADAPADVQAESTRAAFDALCAAASELARVETHLLKIATLRADVPITPLGCELCNVAGLKAEDGKSSRPWEHRGSVGGRLKRDHYLCTGHYWYVYRQGSIPTPEQTRHWDATGSWRVKAS